MQNWPARSPKPRRIRRFARSHSTGHSLVQPGEDTERFTLRLPDKVRKKIMKERQVKRTRSMEMFPTLGCSRKSYRTTGEESNRTTGEGSSRGGRLMGEKQEGWFSSKTLSLFTRASSLRSPKMTAQGDAPMVTPRPFHVSTNADGAGPSLPCPPVWLSCLVKELTFFFPNLNGEGAMLCSTKVYSFVEGEDPFTHFCVLYIIHLSSFISPTHHQCT